MKKGFFKNCARSALFAISVCLFLATCASRPVPKKFQTADSAPARGNAVSLSDDEERLVSAAEKLLGRKYESSVTVGGKNFTLDCTGTVRAVFHSLGIDVARDFALYEGGGVRRLYQTLAAKNLLHKNYPRPGDIVFWDNTYDANGDGDLSNDPLTHAAVVLKTEEDGTIHYVHAHVRHGVIIEVMNLRRPRDYYGEGGKVINNALALGSGISRKNNPPRWLSGDLWKSFGTVLQKKDYFLASPLPRRTELLAALP